MRKTIFFIIAIVVALLGFFGDQAGLSLDAAAIGASMVALATYIFGEAKNDMERVKTKIFADKKWRDPAFWTSLIAALLPVLNTQLKIDFPVETISMVATLIVGWIFKNRQKELTT